MRNSAIFAILLSIFALGSTTVVAQESEERVIDEVVAQVNEGVITLSRVKREAKNIVDLEVQQGKKREDAQKTMDEKQGELIANLINEELLVQKAKELGLESEIENNINQRFVEIMKENGVKTLEALYEQMRGQNIDPAEIRELWRKQAVRDRVIQREVQSKVYWEATQTQLKDYFEKHKAQFTKPETISLSELFLGYAGRDENTVREKARTVLAQLKTGGNWDTITKENGDAGIVTQGAGKVENLNVNELVDTIKIPLKDVKAGGYTEPIDVKDMGLIILRVDKREAASSESFFDESAVRSAMLRERFPDAQKKFFSTLRQDAYIKISETYRPIVSPILFADERKDKAVSEK
jgi:hypothetical protein